MVDEEQQTVNVPQFAGPVIRLAVGGANVFFQIRDRATGQIRRFEVLGASFIDDTATIGKRVQANMWFSLLREALINNIDVNVDPLPGFDTVVRSVTLGGPLI